MLTLCFDLIEKICEELSDKDKIRFMTTSNAMNELKYRFMFNEKIHIGKIESLPYYNNFINVEVDDIICNCFRNNQCDNILQISKNVTHLTISQKYQYNEIGYIPISQNIVIPYNIIDLTVDYWLDLTIKFHVLPKITHLTFGTLFDRPIKDKIPNSVTHLVFGRKFNQPIDYVIPNSVTHIKFGFCFNKPIKNCIPESVTHLTFGYAFKQALDDLPTSVTYIALSRNYDLVISANILSKVQIENLFC
uniref:F-box and FNIP repeat-containing protein n=1 Tax=viral metagenome TaxID=1070528 RepID=A0A6C0C8Q4_9ZZZZ